MLSAFLSAALAASTFTPQVAQRIDGAALDGPRLLEGTLSEPLSGDLTVAARSWALSNRALLGLPARANLKFEKAFQSRFGASLHYQQELGGTAVHGAKVVLTVDRLARVAMVSSSLAGVEAADLQWRLGEREALGLAANVVPLPALQKSGAPYGGGRKELFRVGDALHAGWFVHLPTISPGDNWYVAVDATTSAVLWKQNRVYRAANDASAYALSPGGLDGGVGVTPTIAVSLTHPDGGSMVLPNDGGFLDGTQLTAFNCCVNAGCVLPLPDGGNPDGGLPGPDGGIGMKIVSGTTNIQGQNIQYETVECDRLQRASNDPALHSSGDYVYPPQDPPAQVGGQPGPVLQSDPAHSDEFSEVHAFYQVNKAFDWVRALSGYAAVKFPNQTPAIGPFTMRDERRNPAQKPAVWANVMFPDFNAVSFTCLFAPPCRLLQLGRIDNAAFMPREEFAQIPLPDYRLDVDTLMIFQGNRADFGYDATVLWHEFGHGMVYATAAISFDTLAIDARSANNEAGALHEGFADYLAGAIGGSAIVGPYVGPRAGASASVPGAPQDTYLRTLDNTEACPNVLWGEVHQDSQHVSGALWRARQDFFQGSDSGRTFDAAFYASLVAMAPTVNFAQTAAIVTAHVKDAFVATIADAEAKMQGLFTSRGVTGCSKIIDMTGVTAARPMYGIGGRGAAGVLTGVVPGPYQMKFKTPNGARSVSLQAAVGGGLGGYGSQPDVRLLARSGSPITFNLAGTTLSNDAEKTATGTAAGSTVTAKVDIDVPCGAASEVYFTVGTQASGGQSLQNLQVTFEPALDCTPDAGQGDGGQQPDGGGTVYVKAVPGKSADGSAAQAGCGCGAGSAPALLGLALLALVARRRRS